MYKFYFIQSLKTKDPNLGEQIHLHISKQSKSLFFNVKSKKEFFSTLNDICLDLKENPEFEGIIHIHTHGNEKGIGLFDKFDNLEFAEWNDLRQIFREIYVSTSKKPMLSICACKGFNISRLVPRFEPCPYHYITGSFNPIGFNDSVEGYKKFYDGIISNADLLQNVKEINEAFPKMGFACFNSNQIFQIAVEAYKRDEMVPERIEKRRKEFERIIVKEFGYVNIQQKLFLDFALSDRGTEFYLNKFKEAFYS